MFNRDRFNRLLDLANIWIIRLLCSSRQGTRNTIIRTIICQTVAWILSNTRPTTHAPPHTPHCTRTTTNSGMDSIKQIVLYKWLCYHCIVGQVILKLNNKNQKLFFCSDYFNTFLKRQMLVLGPPELNPIFWGVV